MYLFIDYMNINEIWSVCESSEGGWAVEHEAPTKEEKPQAGFSSGLKLSEMAQIRSANA